MKKNLSIPLASFLIAMIISVSSCQKEPTSLEDEKLAASSSERLQASGLAKANGRIGINVLLNTAVTDALLTDLRKYGNVLEVFPEIKALTMRVESNKLTVIKGLKYVSYANPDAERNGSPVDPILVTDFTNGLSTWNLDAVNVTNAGIPRRTIAQDGTGVYIGVLDTGLPDSWRQYFPNERIATQYARSFGGGGNEQGNVSEQPNKWEHDQNSHGGHVTSTIIGFNRGGTYFNGVAPKATIIPVKVLNQNGSGWASVIAKGILYMANLKSGALKSSPVVINMSLGGPADAIEKAAIDYAIQQGVIIVASAGNSGELGMGYPGAYANVISVAAAGFVREFSSPSWWYTTNVPDPTDADDFYIAPFSSRELAGQDLDVTAPGAAIVGPYQLNSGQLSYFYLSGTSMASPHVAGIVALMAQKKPGLTAPEAETTLQNAAATIPMGSGSRVVNGFTITWEADASGSGLITANAALDLVN